MLPLCEQRQHDHLQIAGLTLLDNQPLPASF